MRRALVVVAVAWCAVSNARAADVGMQLQAVDVLLSQWRIADAAVMTEELYLKYPDVPAVQAAAGKVKFYQSDYAGAVTLLEKAGGAFKGGDELSAAAAMDGDLLGLVRATRDATRGFVATDSAHFSFRAPLGREQILAVYALEALEAAYERIGGDFNWKPRERIVVEVYPNARGLAQVSTLTEQEIETSGTIAICKFNRLMITSPRALLHGYSWLDTLAHEYTHLIISQKSHNTVGIWLHEGLAKYSESRWLGPPGGALGAWQEGLLSKAVKADKLITFEQMHPSMAKLPSQHDTALAFAEVFTVIEYLHKGGPACARKATCPPGAQQGYAVTNAILERLRDGESDEQAIAAVLGTSFEHFKKDWLAYLKGRNFRSTTAVGEGPKLQFKKGKGTPDDEDRDEKVDQGLSAEVRRFARLGNLLRREGRPRAAAMEYERAVSRAGLATPMLHNRLASAYLEAGDDNRALQTLKAIEAAFPDYPQTNVQLGRIHYKRKAWPEARDSYLAANRQNPFNPEVHAALADIYRNLQDDAGTKREIAAFQALNHRDGASDDGPLARDDATDAAVLRLETRPWAQLIIDGVDHGLMTPVEVRLKPGEHTLRLKNPALAVDRTVPLKVGPGDRPAIRLDLSAP